MPTDREYPSKRSRLLRAPWTRIGVVAAVFLGAAALGTGAAWFVARGVEEYTEVAYSDECPLWPFSPEYWRSTGADSTDRYCQAEAIYLGFPWPAAADASRIESDLGTPRDTEEFDGGLRVSSWDAGTSFESFSMTLRVAYVDGRPTVVTLAPT